MYYRNRLKKIFFNEYIHTQNQVEVFESLFVKLPDELVVKARVKVDYDDQLDPIIEAYGKELHVYKILKPPIKRIVYEFLEIVTEGLKNYPLPEILLEREFEVFEKRLPQLKIGEQSLWSYGGTYSTTNLECQVQQSYFFTIPEPPYLKIRKKIEEIQGVLVILGEGESFFEYESFFYKTLDLETIEIHLRKKHA